MGAGGGGGVSAGSTRASPCSLGALAATAAPGYSGLHQSAGVACAQSDAYSMFATSLSLQPRASSGGGKSREELLDEIAADILSKAPQPFHLLWQALPAQTAGALREEEPRGLF